ncbi:MAG: phosphopantetheine-binding protein [Eisenbergiella sp.]
MKETDIIQELVAVINESVSELEIDINETTDILDLDIESLEFVHIFAVIEEKFNIEFEMDDMVDDKLLTIANLAKRINELLEKNS